MNSRLSLILVALILIGGALSLWLKPQDTTIASSSPAMPPIAIELPKQATNSSASTKITKAPAPTKTGKAAVPARTSERTRPGLYVLAINWFPSFCDLKPGVTECRSGGAERFALHGLWPTGEYCDIDARTRAIDEVNDWDSLPAIRVTDATWSALKQAMPGTQSQLERHEWTAHGSCTGVSQDLYFSRAAAFLEIVNASTVFDLFKDNIGRKLTRTKVAKAFDDAFGAGAGKRVRLSCEDTPRGAIIDELTIALYGDAMAGDSFTDLILEAHPRNGGCEGGIVGD
ncbi:MAG: ribonuclease [Devosia sp.]